MQDEGGMIAGATRRLAARDCDRFRPRGRDVTRMRAFVEAAFALAVTLLVVTFGTLPDACALASA